MASHAHALAQMAATWPLALALTLAAGDVGPGACPSTSAEQQSCQPQPGQLQSLQPLQSCPPQPCQLQSWPATTAACFPPSLSGQTTLGQSSQPSPGEVMKRITLRPCNQNETEPCLALEMQISYHLNFARRQCTTSMANLIYTRSNSGRSRLLRPSVLHVLGALRRSLRLGSAWLGAWLSACQVMNGGPPPVLSLCQAAILQCGIARASACSIAKTDL